MMDMQTKHWGVVEEALGLLKADSDRSPMADLLAGSFRHASDLIDQARENETDPKVVLAGCMQAIVAMIMAANKVSGHRCDTTRYHQVLMLARTGCALALEAEERWGGG